MIVTWLIVLLLLLGVGFVLVAAIGLLRLPDFYCRTHAMAKAGAFGGSLLLIGVALAFGSWLVAVKVILIIIFFYATTPVATHMIGRAAFLRGTRSWEGTGVNELQGRYDIQKQNLRGWKPEERGEFEPRE